LISQPDWIAKGYLVVGSKKATNKASLMVVGCYSDFFKLTKPICFRNIWAENWNISESRVDTGFQLGSICPIWVCEKFYPWPYGLLQQWEYTGNY
jgi:hypothetical protein